MEKRYISVSEASIYLGVSPSAIRKWQREGTIPFCRLNGSIRFDIQKLDGWAQG
jgi:excisionase family DNA binding protein